MCRQTPLAAAGGGSRWGSENAGKACRCEGGPCARFAAPVALPLGGAVEASSRMTTAVGTAAELRCPGRLGWSQSTDNGWAVAGGIVTVALGTVIAAGARDLAADDRDAMPAPLPDR
jgi:hypothetical protein